MEAKGSSTSSTCPAVQRSPGPPAFSSTPAAHPEQERKFTRKLQPSFLLHRSTHDEFLALGRFIQGWVFLFERQIEQVGFILFNTHMWLCLMLDTVQAAHCCWSQVCVLLVPALQPPARNVLGTGKFLSHHRETQSCKEPDSMGLSLRSNYSTSWMQCYKTHCFACWHHLQPSQGWLHTH